MSDIICVRLAPRIDEQMVGYSYEVYLKRTVSFKDLKYVINAYFPNFIQMWWFDSPDLINGTLHKISIINYYQITQSSGESYYVIVDTLPKWIHDS